jgi:hypothetical protein
MSPPPLHDRVARRWSRARRATTAGVLAAVASLAALAFTAPAEVHAGAIAAAAVLGLVWPQRDLRQEAFRWIGARAGLAYETAVEAGERSDRFGLFDAVRTQGRLAIRDVALPQPSPWWLPAALLAATLWAWGAFVGVPWTVPWTSAGPSPEAPGGSPFAPPAEAEPVEAPLAEEAPAADPPAPRSDDASAGAPGGEGGASDGGGADGASSERDALERFVEGLREREADPATAAVAEEGADETDEAGEAPQRAPGGERDDGAEAGANAPDPGGEGEPAGDEASEGDGEGEGQGDETGDERADGDEPGGADAPGDGAPEDAGDPSSEGEDGGQAGAAGVDPGEDPGDAGVGVGAPGDASDAVDEDARAPDALPSILGAGPETPIGGVALPGAEGDGAFPEGAAGAAFRRAVEEALTEGEVPVSYQEVIRNYFR